MNTPAIIDDLYTAISLFFKEKLNIQEKKDAVISVIRKFDWKKNEYTFILDVVPWALIEHDKISILYQMMPFGSIFHYKDDLKTNVFVLITHKITIYNTATQKIYEISKQIIPLF
jgi:hypothetical protein